LKPVQQLLGMVTLATAAMIAAAANSPAGTWRSIDDASGRQRSIIRIIEDKGRYTGAVQQIYAEPGDDPANLCRACTGARKDQPVIGMTILWMQQQGNAVISGEILDPETGKVYHGTMTLSPDGKSLKLRGYIGIPLIGRTQTWLRQE
jgi:uncharacterized protein (DUF2147 family)